MNARFMILGLFLLTLLPCVGEMSDVVQDQLSGWKGDSLMLYWMINDSNQYEFNYAVVYAVDGSRIDTAGWTAAAGFKDDDFRIALPKNSAGDITEYWYADDFSAGTTTLDILTELGDLNPSSYSFYIELYNDKDARVGISQVASYNDLTSNHHILGSNLTIPDNLVVWAPTIAPEPTGGLLFLLGTAVLALKRKRHA